MRWLVLAALGGCWRGPVIESAIVEPAAVPAHHRRLPARAVALIGDDELWVAMGTCTDARMWKTRDRGERWILVEPQLTGIERIVGGRHPDDVAVLGATCLGGKPSTRYHLWTSRARGDDWSELDPPPGFRGGDVTMGYVGRTLQFSWRNGEVAGNWELAANGEWDEIPRPANGQPQSVTLAGVTYRPSTDGLIVETRAGSNTVFPRDN